MKDFLRLEESILAKTAVAEDRKSLLQPRKLVGCPKVFDAFEFYAANVEALPTIMGDIDRSGSRSFLRVVVAFVLDPGPLALRKLAGFENKRWWIVSTGR